MFAVYLVVITIFINLVLPQIFKPLATNDEINLPNGSSSLANLPFKSQFIHMFVQHAQIPFSSSLIIATIVLIAYYGAKFTYDQFNDNSL